MAEPTAFGQDHALRATGIDEEFAAEELAWFWGRTHGSFSSRKVLQGDPARKQTLRRRRPILRRYAVSAARLVGGRKERRKLPSPCTAPRGGAAKLALAPAARHHAQSGAGHARLALLKIGALVLAVRVLLQRDQLV